MVNKKPHLLVIGPRGLFGCEGGIEKFTDAFLPRTLPHADITVLTIIKPEKPLPPGLRVIDVPRSKTFKTDKALYLLYSLYFYMTRKYDHVFIFGTNFAVLVPFIRVIFWRSAKIHLRSGSIDHLLPKWSPFVRKLLRLTERLARYSDTVIAVAPSIQNHLRTLGIDAKLIRNGIERTIPPLKSENFPRTPNTVLSIGRITTQKNYKVLIQAIKSLGDEAPVLTIIGGADLSDEAQTLKRMLSTSDKIIFTGPLQREEVLIQLQKQSLYVNSSIHEGMSNAVLEAVQQGIPVLLSDIDANRDLKLPEHHYFHPEDVRSLSKKILDALKTPELYLVNPQNFDDWDTAIQNVLTVTYVIPKNSIEDKI